MTSLVWNQLNNEEKNDLMREWFVDANQCEIEQYYEDSNGFGDWSAGQEGSYDYFWELIEGKKLLVEFPKDFQKWLKKKQQMQKHFKEFYGKNYKQVEMKA